MICIRIESTRSQDAFDTMKEVGMLLADSNQTLRRTQGGVVDALLEFGKLRLWLITLMPRQEEKGELPAIGIHVGEPPKADEIVIFFFVYCSEDSELAKRATKH